jgi:hypothetical protein
MSLQDLCQCKFAHSSLAYTECKFALTQVLIRVLIPCGVPIDNPYKNALGTCISALRDDPS